MSYQPDIAKINDVSEQLCDAVDLGGQERRTKVEKAATRSPNKLPKIKKK